ncbi:MAG: hypothetical protein Tsb0021_16900 [Chlamydiales bacterium]
MSVNFYNFSHKNIDYEISKQKTNPQKNKEGYLDEKQIELILEKSNTSLTKISPRERMKFINSFNKNKEWYLDFLNLRKSLLISKKIHDITKEKYLKLEKIIQQQIINAYQKVSPVPYEPTSKLIHSPFQENLVAEYYRSDADASRSKVLRSFLVNNIINDLDIKLVYSSSFLDFIKRHQESITLNSLDEWDTLQNIGRKTIFDFTHAIDKNNNLTDFASKFYEILNKTPEYIQRNAYPVATYQLEQGTLLLTAGDTWRSNWEFKKQINSVIKKIGYWASPFQFKSLLLENNALEFVLDEKDLFSEFLKQDLLSENNSFKNFSQDHFSNIQNNLNAIKKSILSNEKEDEVNLKHLSFLIRALEKLIVGLDQPKVLQEYPTEFYGVFFNRISEALKAIENNTNESINVRNALNIVHQQIQHILAISSPYKAEEFDFYVRQKIFPTESIISKQLSDHMITTLNHSCMNTLFKVVQGLAHQKNKLLSIAYQKDIYYEGEYAYQLEKDLDIFTNCSTKNGAKLQELDGKEFREKQAFTLNKNQKLDLVHLEFIHNIDKQSKEYFTEDVLAQIHYIIKNGYAADDGFTVLIDITLNSYKSLESLIFADPSLVEWIKEGKLNLVLMRSLQKFDLLGESNAYGGLGLLFNNRENFSDFNDYMVKEQVEGLSRQVITHTFYSMDSEVDEYQKAYSDNINAFYKHLPDELLNGPEDAPVQFSQIHHPSKYFIDLRLGPYKKINEVFCNSMIPLTRTFGLSDANGQASFGFKNTSVNKIGDSFGVYKIRFSVGVLPAEECIFKCVNAFKTIFDKAQETRNSEGNIDEEKVANWISDTYLNTQNN